jgi:hypothetical protein
MGGETIDFIPRETRYDLDLPVALYLFDGIASGRIINVSETGILATFHRPLDLWATGRLCAEARGTYLNIEVRVARVEGGRTGLTFRILNESDRATLREFIELAKLGLDAAPPAPAA